MGSLSKALIDYTEARDDEKTGKLISLICSGIPVEEAVKTAGYSPERYSRIFEALRKHADSPFAVQPDSQNP